MPAAKVDLYRQFKAEYAMPRTPALVRIGPARYLAIQGTGEPGGVDFQARIGALFAVAWTMKMTCKFAGRRDYKVCMPEGQYWGKHKSEGIAGVPKDQWNWRLMIRTPTFITQRQLAAAKKVLRDKGKPAEVLEVKLVDVKEGLCVQVLHVGPYDREFDTIATMQALAKQEGLKFRGLHHEIYISDPRRVAPEKLKTILRQPVG